MAALGLLCCMGFALVAAGEGYSLVAVHHIVVLLLWSTGSRVCRVRSCVTEAPLFSDMWDPPRSGIKPVSPSLAGRFFTIEPPGKPSSPIFHQRIKHFFASEPTWVSF